MRQQLGITKEPLPKPRHAAEALQALLQGPHRKRFLHKRDIGVGIGVGIITNNVFPYMAPLKFDYNNPPNPILIIQASSTGMATSSSPEVLRTRSMAQGEVLRFTRVPFVGAPLSLKGFYSIWGYRRGSPRLWQTAISAWGAVGSPTVLRL